MWHRDSNNPIIFSLDGQIWNVYIGGIRIKQPADKDPTKLDGIVSELGHRGVVVLMNRPTRWGYTVDAVIPSSKVVLLRSPDLGNHFKEAMCMFQDLMNRLKDDGYRVLVIPKNKMNGDQIKAFCDKI